MDYGFFDDERREYVITNPKTPVKWINYVGTLAFGGLVDHTGGALICAGDPALNRITRYLALLPASAFKGQTLYLRLREPAGYRVFSPFFVPTLEPCERYECHVGLGYMRIVSECCGLRSDVTLFVPPGDSRFIQDITVTNVSAHALEVDAIPVVEYTHPDALKQITNADWVPQTMQSRACWEPDGRLVLVQYPFMLRDSRVNYCTSSLPVSSFETDRRRFLGDNEYGTWAHPLSLQAAELSGYEAQGGDNIAALLHRLGTLARGDTRRLITQLGQAPGLEAARPGIAAYRDGARVEQAFAGLAAYWARHLACLQVHTPDADVDRMLNVHTPRQCQTTFHWSRYLSLYQTGYGERGIGFRDSAQDVMGVLAAQPQEARALLRQLLSVQKAGGAAMHQFNPLTMEASVGGAAERPDLPQYYSDDHLWIVLAVTAYLKETGDLGFLDEVVPYYEKDAAGRPLVRATVRHHLEAAVEFTRGDVGAHGLPLLGFADWNDTVNLRTGAESLFTASLYGRALLELAELLQHLDEGGAAERYLAWHAEMRARVNACAWDGAWYVRYFDADGAPLGSQGNVQGQIYANGQTWPVLSGLATPERARRALDSLCERLNTPNGIKLSAPGFNGFDPARGGITTYPPGAKENGGIFLHANPWAIIAEAMLGNGDRAYAYYCQINPAARNGRIDEFECEPYVYPQNMLGDEHPQSGLARNSWLTGTASWAYQAATQYILGLQPCYTGLRIDPCLPRA